ncbi:ATP-binding cassette (ABC) Superfamily [Phytophthora palmivora]|uniref:ATP-binding cassette (ABC) Superfamily n=1 Tax=Phytophthora palmivora TaxID=4796 RepID=A0A2P4XYA0_9STRA|nr:ATP-binding cassette (ABC) Superfamily [Phytophthora palmivora]
MGIALGAGLFGMFMLCEGFMVPFASIPTYWKWGYYIAFHTYSFESFMYEHFSHENTEEAWNLLKSYGMENVNVSRNMLILVGYAAVLQLAGITVLFLRFGRHKHH